MIMLIIVILKNKNSWMYNETVSTEVMKSIFSNNNETD
jgi:hypothetical protein